MKRRAAYLLNLLAMISFALLGQIMLLMPHGQEMLLAGLPDWASPVIGFGLILINLHCLTAILISYGQAGWQLSNSLLALAAGGLAYLYFRAGLPFEGVLLASISASHLLLIVEGLRKRPILSEPVMVVAAIAGIAGAVWIWLQNPPSGWEEAAARPWPLIMAAGFIAASALSAYAAIAIANPTSRILGKLGLLAWLAWIVFFPAARGPVSWTLFSSLALSILLLGWIRWERLILPYGNRLGRQIIIAVDSIVILVVVSLTALVRLGAPSSAELAGEIAFGFSLGIAGLLTLVLIVVNATINGLLTVIAAPDPADLHAEEPTLPAQRMLSRMVAGFLEPFSTSQQALLDRARAQENQVLSLSRQLEAERRRGNQMVLLIELDQQLENRLDPPVAAQLTVNALQRALDCDLATVLMHEAERREFVVTATSSRIPLAMPPGYRQGSQKGLIGRAARLRKTQVVNDTRFDPDHFNFEQEIFLSEVVVPLIHHGHLQGVLVVDDRRAQAFTLADVQAVEATAAVLLRGWERSNYAQRLTDLIQAGITLSTALDTRAAIDEIAESARHTLQARFVFVTLLDRDENLTRIASSGHAASLSRALGQNPREDELIQSTLNAGRPLRVRDVRKYPQAAHLRVDHDGLRSLLAIPIRLHGKTIGAILAFGKVGEIVFTENDESLAGLVASQAGAALESAWLVERLRETSSTTELMFKLSTAIIQAEALQDAAAEIVAKIHQWAGAEATGIVLFTPERKIDVEVVFDQDGAHSGGRHPLEAIEQTLAAGQIMILSPERGRVRSCYPLQTPRRQYGALWLDMPEEDRQGSHLATDLQTFCNQAAIALERAILLRETRQQALALEAAFQELEVTYDQTLEALMSALDARDRETEGHSVRVGRLACLLGEALGLTQLQIKMLERGSLLHDIGKIGISDVILHKPGPLTEEEWKIMRLHPDIGARMVEDIPFLREALPVIRHHQERWDGSGYPQGLRGKEIPLQARIFAVADAFDALTSKRPYRDKISMQEAIAYLRENAGILFDPEIVKILESLGARHRLDTLLDF